MRALAVLAVAVLVSLGPGVGPQQSSAPPSAPQQPPPPPPTQQPPPRQQPPPPPPGGGPPASGAPARDTATKAATGTGIIRGRVVAADTGEPLHRVRVEVDSNAVSRGVATDLDGRFEFQRLAAGRYTLTAGKVGFVRLEHGQRRPFQRGRPIDLANGQVLEKVDIALPRAGVIAGRVVNDLGEAVPQVMVTAVRQSFRAGRPVLSTVASVPSTDDLGQFRVSGLAPGTYYVSTTRLGGLAEIGTAPDDGVVMAPTFHPSAAAQHEARPVTVRLGQEVHGVDIALVATRAASVSGTVLDSSGRPATNLTLSLRGAGGSLLSMMLQFFSMGLPDGKFTLRNVVPADYVLRFTGPNRDTGDTESAEVTITVGEAGVEGLVVPLGPPARIVGHVSWDGDVRPPLSPASLLVRTLGAFGVSGVSAPVAASWTFELKNVPPGRTRFNVGSLPAGWALGGVMSDGREVDELGLDAGAGTTAEVNLVLTNRLTSVSGTVTDAQDKPLEDYTILFFSEDTSRWLLATPVRPDQHGTYKATGLSPGKYCAIALEYLDDGEEQNPEFLAWARERSVRVELVRGEPITLNLKLVKYEGGL